MLQESPQLNQQLSCQGHNADLSHACPPASEALLVPAAQSAPRLVAEPAPRHLDGDRSDMSASRFADPLVSTKVAALIGRGREASGSAHFFPIPELPPAEKFIHVHPGPIRSEPAETQQLLHFFDRGGRGRV